MYQSSTLWLSPCLTHWSTVWEIKTLRLPSEGSLIDYRCPRVYRTEWDDLSSLSILYAIYSCYIYEQSECLQVILCKMKSYHEFYIQKIKYLSFFSVMVSWCSLIPSLREGLRDLMIFYSKFCYTFHIVFATVHFIVLIVSDITFQDSVHRVIWLFLFSFLYVKYIVQTSPSILQCLYSGDIIKELSNCLYNSLIFFFVDMSMTSEWI